MRQPLDETWSGQLLCKCQPIILLCTADSYFCFVFFFFCCFLFCSLLVCLHLVCVCVFNFTESEGIFILCIYLWGKYSHSLPLFARARAFRSLNTYIKDRHKFISILQQTKPITIYTLSFQNCLINSFNKN